MEIQDSLARETKTVISPENRRPVRPLHTAEYGSARFGTLISPVNRGPGQSSASKGGARKRGASPKIFQHPIIQASMPRTAPMIHPQKTPARVSFDQVTVSAMGMTAGLRTTPLGNDKACS